MSTRREDKPTVATVGFLEAQCNAPVPPASERPVATLPIGSALCDELIRGLQLNERRLDAG